MMLILCAYFCRFTVSIFLLFYGSINHQKLARCPLGHRDRLETKSAISGRGKRSSRRLVERHDSATRELPGRPPGLPLRLQFVPKGGWANGTDTRRDLAASVERSLQVAPSGEIGGNRIRSGTVLVSFASRHDVASLRVAQLARAEELYPVYVRRGSNIVKTLLFRRLGTEGEALLLPGDLDVHSGVRRHGELCDRALRADWGGGSAARSRGS